MYQNENGLSHIQMQYNTFHRIFTKCIIKRMIRSISTRISLLL